MAPYRDDGDEDMEDAYVAPAYGVVVWHGIIDHAMYIARIASGLSTVVPVKKIFELDRDTSCRARRAITSSWYSSDEICYHRLAERTRDNDDDIYRHLASAWYSGF